MRAVTLRFVGAVLAVLTSTGAMAQSYYDDQACRQYADQQVAPLRDQVKARRFLVLKFWSIFIRCAFSILLLASDPTVL